MRCVYLPRRGEARILANKFVSKLSYVYHVLHSPSVPSIIDEVYQQISGPGKVKPGHMLLLLSVIASATQVWTAHDCANSEASLFSLPAEANAQTPLWIGAALHVLSAVQNCPPPDLEAVLGIVVLSYLIFNQEGASLRFRSLVATGLMVGQELGLHCVDGEGEIQPANTIQVEVGRRAWWYLAATDW